MFETQLVYGILDTNEFKEINDFVNGTEITWTHIKDTTYENGRTPSIDTPAFAHILLGHDGYRSPFLDKFTPLHQALMNRLDITPKNVFRMRLGFLLNTRYTFPSQPYVYNSPHKDADFDHLTAVFHFMHSDGNTVIFNQTEESDAYSIKESIEPDQNMAVVFDGNYYHASTCPKVFTKRIALTINFTI